MAPVSTTSPVTGKPVAPHYIHSSSLHFQDTHGRSLLLRGVNLSGSAKAPLDQPSWSAHDFWQAAEEGRSSFLNRPLNLEDGSANVHLARLRAWGYNFLRFVFTWESLEHQGPGKYDHEYMDYIVKVLYKCKEYGFRVFMDPHQDVWSRFSGGSGAPIWTLYACGIDPLNISTTYGALLHSEWPERHNASPEDFPQMIWATNYTRLVNQTVWTLFFAGKAFAPKCIIDGVNIQDWLQGKFIDAVGALAERLAQEDGLYDEVVIGWDSMNEPGEGYIGLQNIGVIDKDQRLKKGPSPTPFEGMRLGMGEAVEVECWDFSSMGPKAAPKVILDPQGVKLWLKPEEEATRGGGKWGWKRDQGWKLGECIWAQHGVWDPESSKLLKQDYFRYKPFEPTSHVDFLGDFWRVHWLSYASRVRLHHPEAIHFIQPTVFAIPPEIPESFLKGRACTAPHYYDGLTLMTRHWNWFNADALGVLRHKYWSLLAAVRIGETAIRKSIQDQLGILKGDTSHVYGSYPTIIGEIGCPYDMDDKRAYGYQDGGKGKGDFSSQERAWDASLNAADGPNCLNYTLWTYVPDNSHEWGDLWNGEDLSIWSRDDEKIATAARRARGARNALNKSGKHGGTVTVAPVSSDSGSLHSSSVSLAQSLAAFYDSSLPSSYSAASILSGEGVTPSLILDGSRAVGAVVRPYPVATVGTPHRIDFDIATSTFKYSVVVSSHDIVPNGVCTEIYLPFVHYAATLGAEDELPPNFSIVDPESEQAVEQAEPNTSARTTSSATLSKHAWQAGNPAPAHTPKALVLDVQVGPSHGTFSLSGQTLYWKYPLPASGEVIYTITVRRNGGAFPRESTMKRAGFDDDQRQGTWGEALPFLRTVFS